jgi:hypothetical protein
MPEKLNAHKELVLHNHVRVHLFLHKILENISHHILQKKMKGISKISRKKAGKGVKTN